ncbi:MAG: hypothetical protein LIP01_13215 [Tannerellaceae bacterium]|nr:hypothetical protein [Tannerellaceae bacterium]
MDAQVDEESLRAFFEAYQEVAVLKLGELWAVPIMLRLILIENLRRIVARLQQDQKDRDLANEWMDKAEKSSQEKTSSLVSIVSDMANSDIPLSSAFVSEFSKRLSSRNPSLGIVRNWFEQKLRDEGFTSEELIHTENHNQAADQVSVSNSIKSLRFINSTDWRDFVEDISVVEAVLRTDPAGIYEQMDFTSRDHYRHVIEGLGEQSSYAEKEIAQEAIRLAKDASQNNAKSRVEHVGYYLVDDGLKDLKETIKAKTSFGARIRTLLGTYPLTFYAGSVLLLAFLFTWLFSAYMYSTELRLNTGVLVLLDVFFFLFISQLSLVLVNYVTTLLVSPDFLPRLDFSEGIPEEYSTVVTIPAMIASEEGVDKLLSDLELHYLSNTDTHLKFALLTDFTDADTETVTGDTTVLDYIHAGIQRLNQTYNQGSSIPFYLFHRPRLWNPEEKKWMAYGRKRGEVDGF